MPFKLISKYFIVFVVGVIVTLFSQKALNNLITYKTDESRTMLVTLGDKIREFRKACGKLPTNENGLKALVDPSVEGCAANPFLPLVPVDPWDGTITYIILEDKVYLFPSNPEGSFLKIESW